MPIDAVSSAAGARILIVDDDEMLARSIARMLRLNGHPEIETCGDPTTVADRIERFEPDLMLLDLVMPGVRGQRILESTARSHPGLGIIVLTAEYDARAAVECMRLGARDFIQKPARTEELLASIARVLEESAVRLEAAALRDQFFSTELKHPEVFAEILTRDTKMLRVFSYVEAVARGTQPVLIRGETGTGKELIAAALHKASGRKGDFVAINVAGLDDTLFSDALFGHVRGAFTGADRDRSGMLERARGGTLLLDEIGDLSEASQIKLLRVLQEREYTPLGADEPCPLEARIVAATHHPAEKLREDLYFRLRGYQVELPPLRERLGDLPLLVDLFLAEAAQDLGREKPRIPDELFIDLGNEPFPGNVRELRAICFDAVARHSEGVMPIQLFTESGLRSAAESVPPRKAETTAFPHPMPPLREIEREAVHEALRRVGGNRSAAARMLGVSRPTVLRQIAEPEREDD
ncbi:MAG: sigma-54 dependent transcriptional regulator [Myxococcota bacterium]